MDQLTEAEKDILWGAIEGAFLDTTMWKDGEANIEAAVVSIIAARIKGDSDG